MEFLKYGVTFWFWICLTWHCTFFDDLEWCMVPWWRSRVISGDRNWDTGAFRQRCFGGIGYPWARIVRNHVLQILLVFVFLCVPGHDVLVPIVPRRMWPASESEEGLSLTWGHDFLNRQDLFIVFSDVFCIFLSFVGSHVSHVEIWWLYCACYMFHGSEEEK